jgi:hypothetical protein
VNRTFSSEMSRKASSADFETEIEYADPLTHSLWDLLTDISRNRSSLIYNSALAVFLVIFVCIVAARSIDGKNHYEGRDSSRATYDSFELTNDQYDYISMTCITILLIDCFIRAILYLFIRFKQDNRLLYEDYFLHAENYKFERGLYYIEIMSGLPLCIRLVYIYFMSNTTEDWPAYLRMILRLTEMSSFARLLRITQDTVAIKAIRLALYNSAHYMIVPLFVFSTVSITAGVIMYFAEPCYDVDNCSWQDLFESTVFSVVTMTTVGYGDQSPGLIHGRFFSVMIMFFGILFLSMPLAIVGNEYQNTWNKLKKEQSRLKSEKIKEAEKQAIMMRKDLSQWQLHNFGDYEADLYSDEEDDDGGRRRSRKSTGPNSKQENDDTLTRNMTSSPLYNSIRGFRSSVYKLENDCNDNLQMKTGCVSPIILKDLISVREWSDLLKEQLKATRDMIKKVLDANTKAKYHQHGLFTQRKFNIDEAKAKDIDAPDHRIVGGRYSTGRLLYDEVEEGEENQEKENRNNKNTKGGDNRGTMNQKNETPMSHRNSMIKRTSGRKNSVTGVIGTKSTTINGKKMSTAKVSGVVKGSRKKQRLSITSKRQGSMLFSSKMIGTAEYAKEKAIEDAKNREKSNKLVQKFTRNAKKQILENRRKSSTIHLTTSILGHARNIIPMLLKKEEKMSVSTTLTENEKLEFQLKELPPLERAQYHRLTSIEEEPEKWDNLLYLFLERPSSSRYARMFQMCLFCCILLSIFILYTETLTSYKQYGEGTASCGIVLQQYCSDKSYHTDPGCYVYSDYNVVDPSYNKLSFDCSGNNCFGHGYNFGSDATSMSCEGDNTPFQSNIDLNIHYREVTMFTQPEDVQRRYAICTRIECVNNEVSFDAHVWWIVGEYITNIIFTIEVMLRMICIGSVELYFLDKLNIIDFLSILPFYALIIRASEEGIDPSNIDFSILPSTPIPVILTILKSIKILRVIKLIRYFEGAEVLAQSWTKIWKELVSLIFFLVIIVFLFSLLIYELEAGKECFYDTGDSKCDTSVSSTARKGDRLIINKNGEVSAFYNVFECMWFSFVTILAVGYGDMLVVSNSGRVVALVLMMVGTIYMAIPLTALGEVYYNCHLKYVKNNAENTTAVTVEVNDSDDKEEIEDQIENVFADKDSDIIVQRMHVSTATDLLHSVKHVNTFLTKLLLRANLEFKLDLLSSDYRDYFGKSMDLEPNETKFEKTKFLDACLLVCKEVSHFLRTATEDMTIITTYHVKKENYLAQYHYEKQMDESRRIIEEAKSHN